jgi:hypothetical protein
VFFDRSKACQLLVWILTNKDELEKIDLPPPTILKVNILLNFIIRLLEVVSIALSIMVRQTIIQCYSST